MTTILAQSGPVLVRYSNKYNERGVFIPVTFRGVAIAIENGAGIWSARLFRPRRRQTPEDLFRRISRDWLAGKIEGAWRA